MHAQGGVLSLPFLKSHINAQVFAYFHICKPSLPLSILFKLKTTRTFRHYAAATAHHAA